MRYDQIKAVLDRDTRIDANESAIFSRQLEYIFTQTYDTLFPENTARALFPSLRIDSGANTYTYRAFTEIGEAKIVNDHAADFPAVDLSGVEVTQKIVSLGDSFTYSVMDLRHAAMAGLQLDSAKAQIARRAIERKMDELAWLGDTASGLVGFARAANIIQSTLSDKGTDDTWAGPDASADEILVDINTMWSNVYTTTGGLYSPDTLVLPPAAYAALITKRLDSFNKSTVYDYVLQVNPTIRKIVMSPRLTLAGGSLDTTRAMMFKSAPEVAQLVIPSEFEMMPPEPQSMLYKVACHMRFGGIVVPTPKAITYMDGV